MDLSRTPDSRAVTDTPAPPKLFPQWREVEQDFWLDMFEQYSTALLDQMPEENPDKIRLGTQGSDWDEYMMEKIRMAAKLADEATIQMIYRFERQKPLRQQRQARDRGNEHRKRPVYRR